MQGFPRFWDVLPWDIRSGIDGSQLCLCNSLLPPADPVAWARLFPRCWGQLWCRGGGGRGRWMQANLSLHSSLLCTPWPVCCLVSWNLDETHQQMIIKSSKAKLTIQSLRRMLSLNYLRDILSGMQQHRSHFEQGSVFKVATSDLESLFSDTFTLILSPYALKCGSKSFMYSGFS